MANDLGQQTEFAFMQEGGVLADDGMDKDPVSGNDVPSGSMAKEVRDDVPAMLSEGEYVVPADVVRYHGIDKFEELREEAKMGLSRMEADGRIGGEPVDEDPFPFSVEELEGFQEGGAVGDTYSDVMGDTFTPGQRYPSSPRFPGVGFELRNFTNPKTGRVVVIPFFNGMPMQYIPPDFLEGGQTSGTGTFDPAADERDRQEDEAERARQKGTQGRTDEFIKDFIKTQQGQPQQAAGKSFDQYTSQDWNNYIRNADSKTADVTSKLPIIGDLQRMSERAARSFAKKALRLGTNPATEKPLSTEEKLTLERVLMVAPNTSLTESIINAVTGKGETIEGLPLTEQAGFEFGEPVRKDDVMVKPVTKLPDDLLPDVSGFKEKPVGITDVPPLGERKVTDAREFLEQRGDFEVPDPNIDAQLNEKIEKERAAGPVGMPLEDAQAQFETIDAPRQKEYLWVTFPNANKPVRVEKSEALKLGEAALANIDKDVDIPGVAKVSTTGDNRRKIVSGAVLDKFITSSGLKVAPVDDTKEALQENIKSGPINKDTGLVDKIKSIFDFSASAQEMTPKTREDLFENEIRSEILFDEASVNSIKDLAKSGTLQKKGTVVDRNGKKWESEAVSGEAFFKPYKDSRGKLTVGPGILLEGKQNANRLYSTSEINELFEESFQNARAAVKRNYDTTDMPQKIEKTLTNVIFQMGETKVVKGFKMFTAAIRAKDYDEASKQLTGNYKKPDANGNLTVPAFSYERGAVRVGDTDYKKQMDAAGSERADKNAFFLKPEPVEPRVAVAEQPLPVTTGKMLTEPVLPDLTAFKPQPQPEMTPEQFRAVEQQRAMMQGMRQPSDPTQVGAAPLAPTIDTPGGFQVPTVGVDAAPSALPVEPGPLQDLPVGVSIEADGQFTGTGALPPTPDFTTFEQDRTISAPTEPRPKRRVQRETPTTTGLLDVPQATPTSSVSRRESRVPAPTFAPEPSQADTDAMMPPKVETKPLETDETGVFRLFPEYDIAKNQARIRTENKRISGVGQQIEDAFGLDRDITVVPKIEYKPSSITRLDAQEIVEPKQDTTIFDEQALKKKRDENLATARRVEEQKQIIEKEKQRAEQDRQRALEQEKFRREQNRIAEDQKRRNIELANKFKTSQEVNTQLQKELADAQNQSNKLLDTIKKKDDELAAAKERKFREQQEKEIYDETQKNVQEQMAAAAKEQETAAKKKSEDRKSAYIQHLRDVGNVEGGPGGDAMVKIEIDRQNQAKQDARDRKNPWVDSASSAMLDRQGEIVYSMGNAADIEKHEQRVRFHAEAAARHDAMLRREEEQNRDSGDDGGGPPDITDSGGGGGSDKIVCTEMYRQTQLVDWKKAMKIWDVYQRRYLTPEHQIGYHWLFKPYVKGMQKSGVLTKLGAALAKRRTQHLKHILTKGKAKDDLVGKLWCKIIHPIVYVAGKVKTFCNA